MNQKESKSSRSFRPKPAYFGNDESVPLADFTQSQPISPMQHFSTVSQPLSAVAPVASSKHTTSMNDASSTDKNSTEITTRVLQQLQLQPLELILVHPQEEQPLRQNHHQQHQFQHQHQSKEDSEDCQDVIPHQ